MEENLSTSKSTKSLTLNTGLAIFSMFFGAGNIVFPLAIGQHAQDHNIFAVLGLLITAVGVPLLGLVAMTLFNGNYTHFFERIGKVPGFLVTLFIMGLIGPFGAMPRCISLSYSTLNVFWPNVLTLASFSLLSCVLIFLLTFKKNKLMDLLGYILTPFLLIPLLIIIVRGFLVSPEAPKADHDALQIFQLGLVEGYQTMDLLGAFFFSSVALSCLESGGVKAEHHNLRRIIFLMLRAAVIGAGLLAAIYLGFSYVAAFNSETLLGIPKDELLASLALHILGPYAGIVAVVAVSMACLTTAMALAVVFAEFVQNRVFLQKVPYIPTLAGTLVVTYFVSTLSFTGIAAFLVPILQICYPALIMLSICNIASKLYHVKMVKTPVLLTFTISLVAFVWEKWM